jgi:pimeloyl-ACP methyl ester carboxylesterase
MATFVLVHGAFHGGWCWQKVRPILHKAGHEVLLPTLTGLGERAHLLRPEIGLNVHIQDIVSVLTYEDLHEVILVGHSYAGMVITGVADLLPWRISHLVYLDAFLPSNGQALCEQFRPEDWSAILDRVATSGEGWRWMIQDTATELTNWGITDRENREWVGARLRPQSIKTATETLCLANPPEAGQIPHTFIYCTAHRPQRETYHRSEVKARTEPGWRYRQLASGHDGMITAPDALTELLLETVVIPPRKGRVCSPGR